MNALGRSSLVAVVALQAAIAIPADAPGLSPRETAAAILFAGDESALEIHLLRSTREELRLMDPDLRQGLLEVLRPLGILARDDGATVEHLKGGDALARVTIGGEVIEVGLEEPSVERAREWRMGEDDPSPEGLVDLEMTVSEPRGAYVYVLPMLLSLREEDGAWRLVRANTGVNPFHADFLALVQWLDAPALADRVHRTFATRNVRSVVSDVRTVISAEIAYASSNGFYDQLACLERPRSCNATLPAGTPSFLIADLASLQPRGGYTRSFHPGPAPDAAAIRSMGASVTSLTAFAYVAVPTRPGISGTVALCGDSTGRVCVQEDGSEPSVVDGSCVPCAALQ